MDLIYHGNVPKGVCSALSEKYFIISKIIEPVDLAETKFIATCAEVPKMALKTFTESTEPVRFYFLKPYPTGKLKSRFSFPPQKSCQN